MPNPVTRGVEGERAEIVPTTHQGERSIGVGMPAWIKLNQFGSEVRAFFGHTPYLVGSAARAKEWRDVDVRLILADEEFDAIFGELTRPRCLNEKWNAACLAWTARGREITALPIDFQIDRQTEANRVYGGEMRHPLILTDLAHDRA